MTDERIADLLRDILHMEQKADVWDTGNPVIQVIGFKGDELVRETFDVPEGIKQESFHSTVAMLYVACVVMSSLPDTVVAAMKGAQVAGLMMFSEAWGLRVERHNLPPDDLQNNIEKVRKEVEEFGGVRNHPDAVDTKTASFYDGSRIRMMTLVRGQAEVDDLGEDDAIDTPTTIAMQALCQQVKWLLS